MQQIRIEYMPLAELVKRYHPRNPKEHDIGGLITSMRKFGFKTPGGIDEKSGLFAEGHGRVIALAEMQRQQMDAPKGIDARKDDWYAPVIRGYEFDTPEQLEAYLITANRMTELGGWDEPKLAEMLQELANTDAELLRATGYDEDDLQALLEELTPHVPTEDSGAQMDKAAELQKKWQVERGQLWSIGKHQLLCDDAKQDRWAEGRVVFTDPPYGISVDTSWLSTLHIQRGKPANKSDDKLQGDDGSLDLSFLFEYDRRFIWGFPYIYDACATGWIVWDKQPGVDERGIVTPVEMASTTLRKGFDIIRVMWGGFYRAAGETREPHPTQKPVQIITPFIEQWTDDSDVVYDPFGGSGTTMVACEQLGRQCRMIEIEPKYCAVILDRMERMGLTPELLSTN